mmetsp:Transcript_17212/g.28990  ORF Transcript_17212/g.28990 Transcript_17212/m.28990 type:complete len:110 (+) Transcript_17212:1961-2290(+)
MDVRDEAYARITGSEISINPQSITPSEGSRSQSDKTIVSEKSSQLAAAEKMFSVNKKGTDEYDSKLQEQACSLQQSINDSNVIGNEFNRKEAEDKIEIDFLENDAILKF